MFCEKICKYVNIMWLLLTQKTLCWSLFSILSIVKFFRALILKNICKWLFLKMCLQKSFIKRINFTLKKTIFSTSISNFISWLVSQEVCIHSHRIFLWHGEKQKQPPELFCRRSYWPKAFCRPKAWNFI